MGQVVLDLSGTTALQPTAVVLLSAMRRYLRPRGIRMTLTGTPDRLRRTLQDCGLLGLYDTGP